MARVISSSGLKRVGGKESRFFVVSDTPIQPRLSTAFSDFHYEDQRENQIVREERTPVGSPR